MGGTKDYIKQIQENLNARIGTNCINLSLKQLHSDGEKVDHTPTEEVTAAETVQRSKSACLLLQAPHIEVSRNSSVNGGLREPRQKSTTVMRDLKTHKK